MKVLTAQDVQAECRGRFGEDSVVYCNMRELDEELRECEQRFEEGEGSTSHIYGLRFEYYQACLHAAESLAEHLGCRVLDHGMQNGKLQFGFFSGRQTQEQLEVLGAFDSLGDLEQGGMLFVDFDDERTKDVPFGD